MIDLSYIFYNTFIYWSIATVLAGFFIYHKFVHFWLWAFLIALCYNIYGYMMGWDIIWQIVISITIIVLYVGLQYLCIFFFPKKQQRDYAGLILTLALSLCIENGIQYIYWPNTISLDQYFSFWPVFFWVSIIFFFFLIFYFFRIAFIWKIYTSIREKDKVSSSIWIRTNKLTIFVSLFFLIILIITAFLLLSETNIKATDWFYFLVKALGIMLLVWPKNIHMMMVWALLYVTMEYILFVLLDFPLWYRETFTLWLILIILIFKPQGIFSSSQRNI